MNSPIPDMADVQGVIHRSYRLPHSRHLMFEFSGPEAGAELIRFLEPKVTDSAVSHQGQLDFALNVGITFRGLQALSVDEAVLREFPTDFRELPFSDVDGDRTLGDFGESAPRNWWNRKFRTEQIHLIVHLYGRGDSAPNSELERVTEQVREVSRRAGVVELVPTRDGKPVEGRSLPDGPGRIHFGYRDGISQPVVNWRDDASIRDQPNVVDFRHFLLGYSNDDVPSSPFREPGLAFVRNGSYSAFRWLYQDVAKFNQFLEDEASVAPDSMSGDQAKEWLAAKLLGRWRDGTPLVMSPEGPEESLSTSNDFEYGGDLRGEKCPVGAHIRVTNPRDQELGFAEQLDGGVPRVIRRGAPYGDVLEGTVDDGKERGLAGIFLCASITRQVFKLLVWMNETNFSPLFQDNHGQDAFGNRAFPEANPMYSIGTGAARKQVKLLDFVRTDGTAFFLLPSLTTLRLLARG